MDTASVPLKWKLCRSKVKQGDRESKQTQETPGAQMALEGLENTWLWLDNPVNTHMRGMIESREESCPWEWTAPGGDPIHMQMLPGR